MDNKEIDKKTELNNRIRDKYGITIEEYIPVGIPDKKLFGPGEWQDEPDEEYFEYSGIKCLVWRNGLGSWCGYIFIQDKSSIDEETIDDIFSDVHGGITYTQEQIDGSLKIGFDCGHYNDISPYVEYSLRILRELNPKLSENLKKLEECKSVFPPKTYKNIEFARNECRKMVDTFLR